MHQYKLYIFLVAVQRATAALDFLTSYETFDARLEEVKDPDSEERVKRSAYGGDSNNIAKADKSYSYKFKQFNQEFDVILDEKGPFAEGATLELYEAKGVSKVEKLDVGSYYKGRLKGKNN